MAIFRATIQRIQYTLLSFRSWYSNQNHSGNQPTDTQPYSTAITLGWLEGLAGLCIDQFGRVERSYAIAARVLNKH